jgi:hypothetical protein
MRVLKEIGAQILHALLAMVILLPVAMWPDLVAPWALSGFLIGFLREDTQHRVPDAGGSEGWGWVKKSFPIGGRWRDIWAFAVGGLADGAIVRWWIGG